MSDALTDIARDERRHEYFCDFVASVIDYCVTPNDHTHQIVLQDAKSCDSVPTGYWRGQTALAKGIEDWLQKLLNQDEFIWIKWLLRIQYNTREHEGYSRYKMSLYDKAKSLSPYKNKTIVEMDYGIGFAHVGGEIKNSIDKLIETNGLMTYDADRYAIILDQPIQGKVVWLGNGCNYNKTNEYETPIASERKRIRKNNQKQDV